MQKWEYLYYESVAYDGIDPENKEILYDKGKAGWELVSVVHLPANPGVRQGFLFYFKRPKE